MCDYANDDSDYSTDVQSEAENSLESTEQETEMAKQIKRKPQIKRGGYRSINVFCKTKIDSENYCLLLIVCCLVCYSSYQQCTVG